MKRRGFLGRMAGGSVAGAAGISSAEDPVAAAGPLAKTPAVIMAPRHDGVEVVWAVSRLAKGRVEWKGEDGSAGTAAADRFGMVPQGDEILRVRIAGLKAGGKYQLRAITEAADGKEKIEGPWKKFGTLDPLGKSTEFVVWNDTHQNAATIEKLHELTPRGDFLLWNGDYRVAFCHIPLRWKVERVIKPGDYGNGNYDSYSRSSRDAWHDALVAWKTQVVVSGHMHETAWIPGTAEFPYGQLVGGGPQPERATWIEGKADATALRFVTKGLDGKVIETVEFKPLAT